MVSKTVSAYVGEEHFKYTIQDPSQNESTADVTAMVRGPAKSRTRLE